MTEVLQGKYRITREIARSNDIVYEAMDVQLGRRIALKELNIAPGMTGQPRRERIERFNREARAAGRLTHPNIVSIFAAGEENGRYFIAMEFLEGQTLRDRMQARGAFSVKEALDIACQILDALAFAHANRVIHRDIKPDNIHILPGGQVKLTDFGIARLTEEPALTVDGQVFGTPSYMSPEQIEGREIDYRADLFSVGIVLYEMLTGRKPFTGDSVVSITYAIMNATPPPMNGIPMGIEQVVRRALSKSPLQRQRSAEEMKLDLRNAEQTPAAFLPPPQTGLGQLGQTGGYGYGSPGANSGGYAQPQNYPAPQAQAGYGVPPTGYGALQGNSAPPSARGQTGLPWQWNNAGTNAQPAPAPMHYPSQAGYPPTVVQGVPQGGMQPYASPPYPARPPEPLITLSPGTKQFLVAVLIAACVGVVLAFGVIAFFRSYDQYKSNVSSQKIADILKIGAAAYEKGDYTTAAARFQQALSAKPGDSDRARINYNLAATYIRLGQIERQNRNLSRAEAFLQKALETAPAELGDLARRELAGIQEAQGNLEGAKQTRSAIDGIGIGTVPPNLNNVDPVTVGGGTATTDLLADRRARARQEINAGNQARQQGDLSAAQEHWREAISLAPGTPERDEAKQNLDSSSGGEE